MYNNKRINNLIIKCMVMSIDVHVNTCNTRRVLTLWYGGVYIYMVYINTWRAHPKDVNKDFAKHRKIC